MISAISWIPRGVARAQPLKFEISPEELERVQALAKEEELIEQENNAAESSEEVNAGNTNEDVLKPEFKMDDYDMDEIKEQDEDGDDLYDEEEEFEITEEGGKAFAMEPVIDEEYAEDDQIKPSDSLLIVAVTEDDYSHLEVQLFTDDGSLFVHHDITLSDFPLCIAWTDCPPYLLDGQQLSVGNYVAVGSFDPAIEIWNLDVLDPLEPSAVLGGTEKKGKKNKKTKPVYRPGSHEDAVMSLSWNSSYRQALASGSADMSVKIWDITTQACSHTFKHHTDKVQAVQFHPTEAWLLATGGFDKSIALVDCRTAQVTSRYSVAADLEAMVWNPFNSNQLYCALEDGAVACVDVRQASKPLFTFQAHDKTASSLSFSHGIPGMLATASVDKTVRVWDVQTASNTVAPQLVAYKSVSVGKLFSVSFYQSSPYVLAAGGDKGVVAIWESDELAEIQNHFEGRVKNSVHDNIYNGLIAPLQTMDIEQPQTATTTTATTPAAPVPPQNTNTSDADKKKKKKNKK